MTPDALSATISLKLIELLANGLVMTMCRVRQPKGVSVGVALRVTDGDRDGETVREGDTDGVCDTEPPNVWLRDDVGDTLLVTDALRVRDAVTLPDAADDAFTLADAVGEPPRDGERELLAVTEPGLEALAVAERDALHERLRDTVCDAVGVGDDAIAPDGAALADREPEPLRVWEPVPLCVREGVRDDDDESDTRVDGGADADSDADGEREAPPRDRVDEPLTLKARDGDAEPDGDIDRVGDPDRDCAGDDVDEDDSDLERDDVAVADAESDADCVRDDVTDGDARVTVTDADADVDAPNDSDGDRDGVLELVATPLYDRDAETLAVYDCEADTERDAARERDTEVVAVNDGQASPAMEKVMLYAEVSGKLAIVRLYSSRALMYWPMARVLNVPSLRL